MKAILIVVDGISFRLADDAGVNHVLSSDKADLRNFSFGEGDEIGVRAVPQAIALEAKIFQAKTTHAGLHHLRRPGKKILDAPNFDRRIVDINPIIQKWDGLVDDQRHNQKIAVAKLASRGY